MSVLFFAPQRNQALAEARKLGHRVPGDSQTGEGWGGLRDYNAANPSNTKSMVRCRDCKKAITVHNGTGEIGGDALQASCPKQEG